MRILHVIPALSRHYGGGPGVVAALAENQTRQGHDVSILTTDAHDAATRVPAGTRVENGIRIHRARNLSNRLAYGQKIFINAGLEQAVDGGVSSYDVVHLHDYRTIQNAVIARAARRAEVPYVLQAHGALNTAEKALPKRVFDAAAGRRLLLNAARLLALNETEADAYASMGARREKIVPIANGIERSIAQAPPGKDGAFRERIGISSDTPLALYLGRLHPSKSVDLLLQAFATLPWAKNGYRLAIVGPNDGAEADLRRLVVEHRLEDAVHFVGFIDEETKWSAYRSADVVVVPSFFGFPLVALEAWAVGRPIIATRRHERLGFLDATGGIETDATPSALAAALSGVLDNRKRSDELGARGREAIFARFTWDQIAARTVEIYEEARRS